MFYLRYKSLAFKLFSFILILNFSCQSIYYHPDTHEYSDLEVIPYENQRFFIETEGFPKLHAWHLKTQKQNSRGLVVQFHGNAQNMSAHAYYLTWFLEQGFDVITFDYRGYGQSEGEVERSGLIEDSRRVLEYVAKNHSEQKIILLGQSLGGAKLSVALSSYPKQNAFSMLILDSTFYSYRSVVRRKIASLWPLWPFQYPLAYLFSDQDSPEKAFTKISIPIFLTHGREDTVVPFKEAEDINTALKQHPKVRFFPFKSEQHLAAFSWPKAPAGKTLLEFWEELSSKNKN